MLLNDKEPGMNVFVLCTVLQLNFFAISHLSSSLQLLHVSKALHLSGSRSFTIWLAFC